jgi:hypothetical protein
VWKDNGRIDGTAANGNQRPTAPVPVAEFLDRRHGVGNGITSPRKLAAI